MTIETKYDIGDKVWFMWNNKPTAMRIGHIEAYCGYCYNDYASEIIGKKIVYIEEYGEYRMPESDLFPTKEELIKSL